MTHFKKILLGSLVTVSLTGGLVACQNKAAQSQAPCTQTDLSVRCLLDMGETKLQATTLPFERVSGAAELAVAYNSSNNTDAATRLINQALTETKTLTDLKERGNSYSEILVALASMTPNENFESWAADIKGTISDLDANKQAEILAKAVIAQMVHGDKKEALQAGLDLAEDTPAAENAKAVTLRKLADILAKNGDFDGAQKAINAITMSITYYQSMVRSDVAHHANKAGKTKLAKSLLAEAEPIARAQDNGYFVGAALRDIGYAHAVNGNLDTARKYFSDALKATAIAPKQNEKARATSRVATRMSDIGLHAETKDILNTSVELAKEIDPGIFRNFSYYEIIGASAFSGQFDISNTLIEDIEDISMGSTSSLKNAARRDIAWGLARHGKLEEAVNMVNTITTPREYLQAISRVIRGQNNPKMTALPRYL